MNKDRRNTINALYARLNTVQENLKLPDGLLDELADIIQEIENVKDEEAEALSNLPESLQEGERGQAMQEAIDALEDATAKVGEYFDSLNETFGDNDAPFSEALESLDNASAG